jgi:hypothetical protein
MKERKTSAGSKNRSVKLLFFGEKLNYICSKVDDEGDNDNKFEVYIDYDYYGDSDDDDNDDDEVAT